MRVVMMSTGAFAAPTLRALLDSPHDVALLVTRPPVLGRGKRRPPPNPSAEVAAARGLRVWSPSSINDPAAAEELGRLRADLLVVCDYGEILKPHVLGRARLGGINLHASLLPKYRGAAPINWAIFHGETETGDTVFQLTPGMDSGPILAQRSTPIDPEETAVELKARLALLGAELVLLTVDELAAGRAVARPQDSALSTRAPRLTKQDGAIDWTRSAAAIKNQVRAMQPWPTAYTFWRQGEQEPLRLILERVREAEEALEPAQPGAVVEAGPRLVVACGAGFLEIEQVQPAGKRSMPAADMLRGHALQIGDVLGGEGT